MMDAVLEEMQFPQSFTGLPEGVVPEKLSLRTEGDAEAKPGKIATFTVRILFRQNASWQGTLSWVDHQMENRFRSVMMTYRWRMPLKALVRLLRIFLMRVFLLQHSRES